MVKTMMRARKTDTEVDKVTKKDQRAEDPNRKEEEMMIMMMK